MYWRGCIRGLSASFLEGGTNLHCIRDYFSHALAVFKTCGLHKVWERSARTVAGPAPSHFVSRQERKEITQHADSGNMKTKAYTTGSDSQHTYREASRSQRLQGKTTSNGWRQKSCKGQRHRTPRRPARWKTSCAPACHTTCALARTLHDCRPVPTPLQRGNLAIFQIQPPTRPRRDHAVATNSWQFPPSQAAAKPIEWPVRPEATASWRPQPHRLTQTHPLRGRHGLAGACAPASLPRGTPMADRYTPAASIFPPRTRRHCPAVTVPPAARRRRPATAPPSMYCDRPAATAPPPSHRFAPPTPRRHHPITTPPPPSHYPVTAPPLPCRQSPSTILPPPSALADSKPQLSRSVGDGSFHGRPDVTPETRRRDGWRGSAAVVGAPGGWVNWGSG